MLQTRNTSLLHAYRHPSHGRTNKPTHHHGTDKAFCINIVHVDSSVRKNCSEGIFVIKYVINGSMNNLSIFVTYCTHSFLSSSALTFAALALDSASLILARTLSRSFFIKASLPSYYSLRVSPPLPPSSLPPILLFHLVYSYYFKDSRI